uniref:ShKT domain-containing protein n=1 Tax=Odontella aurita TaxID=265563 RepID=A0A7S4KAU0_9STRA|mmetsp:Transcript_7891/g.23324  ORF Transcript_7891/g.23324 Transcript_7891/m.23324 type:complete len:157 (+) Transcript_7891:235-705(+)
MLKNCGKSCGVCGKFEKAKTETETVIYTPPLLMNPCADGHDRCAEWAGLGECDKHLQYMQNNCQKSCGVCLPDGTPCSDNHEKCGRWAERGECAANPKYMHRNCKKSCEVCDQYRMISVKCVDEDERCAMWAENSECDNNPGYMLNSCAKICVRPK